MTGGNQTRPRFARFVRRFAVPIILAWLLVTVAVNVFWPPIESAARNHAVTMSPQDAPSMIAAKTDRCDVSRVRLRQRRHGGARKRHHAR